MTWAIRISNKLKKTSAFWKSVSSRRRRRKKNSSKGNGHNSDKARGSVNSETGTNSSRTKRARNRINDLNRALEEVSLMPTKPLEANSNNPPIRPRAPTKTTCKTNPPPLLKRMDNSERSHHPTNNRKCSNRWAQNRARCLKMKPSVCSIH